MRKALNPSKTSKPNNFRKCLVDSKLGTSVEVRKAYDMQGMYMIYYYINVTNYLQVLSSSAYSSVQQSPLLIKESLRTLPRHHAASMCSTQPSLEPNPS